MLIESIANPKSSQHHPTTAQIYLPWHQMHHQDYDLNLWNFFKEELDFLYIADSLYLESKLFKASGILKIVIRFEEIWSNLHFCFSRIWWILLQWRCPAGVCRGYDGAIIANSSKISTPGARLRLCERILDRFGVLQGFLGIISEEQIKVFYLWWFSIDKSYPPPTHTHLAAA